MGSWPRPIFLEILLEIRGTARLYISRNLGGNKAYTPAFPEGKLIFFHYETGRFIDLVTGKYKYKIVILYAYNGKSAP